MTDTIEKEEPLYNLMSEGLPRQFAPGTTWLSTCVDFPLPTRTVHGHTSLYLVQGQDASVLFDTGSPSSWDRISATLDELLGDKPLTYIVPSHPELPHTGNILRLVQKYPDVVAIGDVRDYHLFFPEIVPNLRKGVAGDRIDLGGGEEFVLIDAMIRDLPNTLWGFSTASDVLFSADGFCYMHHPELDDEDPMHFPNECGLLTSELEAPPTVENAAMFMGSAVYWARWVDDSDELYPRIKKAFDNLGVKMVAPAHGNVIDNLEEVMPIIHRGHKTAYRG